MLSLILILVGVYLFLGWLIVEAIIVFDILVDFVFEHDIILDKRSALAILLLLGILWPISLVVTSVDLLYRYMNYQVKEVIERTKR